MCNQQMFDEVGVQNRSSGEVYMRNHGTGHICASFKWTWQVGEGFKLGENSQKLLH